MSLIRFIVVASDGQRRPRIVGSLFTVQPELAKRTGERGGGLARNKETVHGLA